MSARLAAMRAKDAVGQFGEELAAQHLADAGLEIIERNWRCARGELDIIAREGPTIVFCEVKTRSSVAYGSPLASVSVVKAERLRRLALLWLNQRRADGSIGHWPELRFDVVGVLRSRVGPAEVTHIRAAF